MSRKMKLLFFLSAVIVMVWLAWSEAQADDGHGHNHGDGGDVTVGGDTVNVGVGGDTVTSLGMQGNNANYDSKSLALGNVLGDVDIAGCLGSTQWSTPVYGKQKLVINWVCVAEFYIRYQQPGLAAMALCNTEILKEFDSEEACEDAHQFLTQAVVAQAVSESEDEDEEGFHQEQRSMNMMLQSEIEQLKEMYERQPRATQRTVVEQRPLLTESQKARLLEEIQK